MESAGNIFKLQQPESLFRSTYSLSIRIWHWLIFVTITASMLMVLLASTMFSMKDNIPKVQELVQGKGGVITTAQARSVAHEYSDKLWMTHKYIGFGLAFLLLSRIVIEFVHSKEQRIAGKIKKAMKLQTQTQQQRYDRSHYLMVKWGYVIFYAMILVMALTGLGLAFEDVPVFKSNHEAIAEIHEFFQYGIYAYIFFHIGGVIRADVTDNKGIVSRMINGG